MSTTLNPRETTRFRRKFSAAAVAFDLDGTLVDSLPVVERAWSAFAARMGLPPAVVLERIHGVRAEESVAHFAPKGSDVAALAKEILTYEQVHADETVEIAGAGRFLRSLPSERVGLVTSSPEQLALARLAGARLRAPRVTVTAECVERGKPAPDGYLRCAELLGVPPTELLVFEDAEAGIQAGLSAKAQVVVVGDFASASTDGLPRITDYREVAVEPPGPGGRVRIRLS